MHRLFTKRILFSLLVLLTFCITTAGAAPKIAPGRILVKPAAGLSEAKLAKILERSQGRAKRTLRGIGVHVVEVPEKAELAIVRALQRNKHIAFAEPDALLEPVNAVNDPKFAQQWHLPMMGAPAAWDVADGAGVIVAVLDTGVYAGHPDLSGKMLPGWNTVSNNTVTDDIHNHGTWVAGVVAAHTNNGIGVASTAPGAQIMPIRITDRSDGWAYASDMAEGITWAADNGARVANLSYHGAAGSASVANAASYMMTRGGVVVVAAGNDNTDYGYANHASLFVAGATDSNDVRASYSSYGTFLDIAAPGSGILTTSRNGGYSSVFGTSFATPNAAAVAALVMAANPSLNPTDVTAIIINTAQDLGNAGWDPYYGHGRVNAQAATELAANAETSDATAPDTRLLSPANGSSLSGDVNISVRATDGFGVTSVELLVDGQTVAEEILGSNDVYAFTWESTSVSDGQHSLSARAHDAAGNAGHSQAVTVNVVNVADDTPPVVTITAPTGASYDRRVTVAAHATDDHSVSHLAIYGDGKLLCSGTSSASCTWNLRKVGDGEHQVTATAVDAAGNQGNAFVSFTKGWGSGESESGDKPKRGKGKNR